jgi:hypothetical protein
MSAHLQYKLQTLEITPPAGTWRNISARLDEEFDASEISLSDKLFDLQIEPPASSFESILRGLKRETPQQKSGKLISLPFKRLAIAAAIIGLIFISTLILLNSGGDIKAVSQKKEPVEQKATSANKDQPITAKVNSGISSKSLAFATPLIRKNKSSKKEIAGLPIREKTYSQSMKDIVYADIPVVNAVSGNNNISVSSPPIRDEKGNIIMDVNLITSADKNYITVTGPNGKQTKISAKFLPLLSYLNNADRRDDRTGFMVLESSLWKTRFQEWRNKMLQQGSFFPAGNNFFGIVELKEMIQATNNY